MLRITPRNKTMKWNEQIRHERKSRGWTQSSLAEKMGTNTYTVNRWEIGYTFPHPFYRHKLTTLLGINFEEREFLQDDPEFDHNTYEQSLLLSLSFPTSLKALW